MSDTTETTSRPPLRYLFVSADRYPPVRVDVAVLFGAELSRRGHEIDWLLQSEVACSSAYVTDWLGGRVWVGANSPGSTRWRRIVKHLHGLRNDCRMFRLARTNHYDFIQVKDKFLSALMAILAARVSGTRFVYWLSYPLPEESIVRSKERSARYPIFYRIRGHVFRVLLYKVITPLASHVFVQSEQMRRDFVARGVAPDKMTVVPMGVDLDRVTKALARRGLDNPANEAWLVYLGTLTSTRRIEFLVRVLVRVRATHSDAVLYLVGSSDDERGEDVIRTEARRLGMSDCVRITGALPMDDAWAYVAAAEVCLAPSYPSAVLDSTSPTKLVEYMALGIAVVGSDHPEQGPMIRDSGAGICVPYDEDTFAGAICELLDDREQARAMGRRGQHYVKTHRSYALIAEQVDKVYRELVDRWAGSASEREPGPAGQTGTPRPSQRINGSTRSG